MSINTCALTGHITADPELRHTHSGTAVTDVTIGVNHGHGDRQETAFVGVTIWGAPAEALCKHLRKGAHIAVAGRITQESWEDKTSGQKRSKTKVTADSVQWLDRPTQSRTPPTDPAPSNPF